MRIEAYTQVQNLYQASKVNKPQKTQKVGFMDQLQISSVGKDIQTAKMAVNNTPDIRMDLVSKIKGQIDAGTYSVDSDSFAEKLFAKNNRTL